MNKEKFNHVAEQFNRLFDPDRLDEIGREHDFYRQKCKILPHRLIPSILTSLITSSLTFIKGFWQDFRLLFRDVEVCYSPFHRRLCEQGFANLMRAFCAELIRTCVGRVCKPVISEHLTRFEDVIIHDATSQSLKGSELLGQAFPSRWSRVPSAVKLHLTMSFFCDQIEHVSLTADTASESHYAPPPVSLRDCLFLGDGAFDSLDYLEAIDDYGGWFIVRFRKTANPIVHRCIVDGERRPEWEGKKLKEFQDELEGHHVDMDVEWERQDKANFRGRLIMRWIPPEKRRDDADEGTHMFLATNLERKEFAADVVRLLYRIRWQVELLIREVKSGANLSAYITDKPPLAEGLVWASIAAAILMRFVAHATQWTFQTIAAISTQITTRAVRRSLPDFLAALVHGDESSPQKLKRMMEHLVEVAPRADPERDRKSGRWAAGARLAPG